MPPAAKLLYVMAQMCEVQSLADLARKAGLEERTASRMIGLLKKHKWFKPEHRGHRIVPVPVLPPSEDARRTRILLVRYEVTPHKGEFLLKEFHDVTLFADDKVDNARPDFLESPLTGENLEYDRYYPVLRYASEYNGLQHYGPTEAFPSQEKADRQQANDLMKIGLSQQNGVRLVVFTYEDLSLAGVLAKLPQDLPGRPVDRSSRYVRTLERLAAEHRKWAAGVEAARIPVKPTAPATSTTPVVPNKRE